LIFPQETVEYDGMGGNFKEVCKEMIDMDVWAVLQKVKAMLFEDL